MGEEAGSAISRGKVGSGRALEQAARGLSLLCKGALQLQIWSWTSLGTFRHVCSGSGAASSLPGNHNCKVLSVALASASAQYMAALHPDSVAVWFC